MFILKRRSKINYLKFHLKNLEKEEQSKNKVGGRKETLERKINVLESNKEI